MVQGEEIVRWASEIDELSKNQSEGMQMDNQNVTQSLYNPHALFIFDPKFHLPSI